MVGGRGRGYLFRWWGCSARPEGRWAQWVESGHHPHVTAGTSFISSLFRPSGCSAYRGVAQGGGAKCQAAQPSRLLGGVRGEPCKPPSAGGRGCDHRLGLVCSGPARLVWAAWPSLEPLFFLFALSYPAARRVFISTVLWASASDTSRVGKKGNFTHSAPLLGAACGDVGCCAGRRLAPWRRRPTHFPDACWSCRRAEPPGLGFFRAQDS